MLLVEYTLLDKLQVINETTEGGQSRLKLKGRFQKCDEQNNNGRIYPRKILESQVQKIQEKINDRSLVGALDHPANDAIHLSQASHLITGLSVDKNGDVIGECEILSTPNGKIVEALINDGVKIGISSRGVGSVSEGREGKIVNEDFKLITFDLVSDPSTKGAYPELTESIRENSQRAQAIVSKHKKQRVLMTMLESKVSKALERIKKYGKKKSKKTTQIDSIELFGDRYDEIGGGRALAGAPKVPASARPGSPENQDARAQKKYRKESAEYAKKFKKPIRTKGKRDLYRGLPDTFRGYGTSEPSSQNDSVELFGDIIFETFVGLDKKRRAKRARRVHRGLARLEKKERVATKIKPGGEEAAAQKLDMLGQHELAAGTRGGAFTDPFPNKPSAAQRFSKHFQKRGAQGEHDIALARGLENRNRGKKK